MIYLFYRNKSILSR